ncbi:DNA alkylation repair protein [Candidatus Woesearchaeota archaeon]|nr:DNA alkylation repair protein [Candidatus Woesearchaeota archaeon]
MFNELKEIRKEFKQHSNKSRAEIGQKFFKTKKGEYGEGDVFLGSTVPEQRKIAETHKDLPIKYIEALIRSKIHEERLVALFILIKQFQKNKDKKLVNFYLSHRNRVNNWDLVDSSADKILGQAILDGLKDKWLLYSLAKSKKLWDKRIAIIATFQFIKNNKFEDTLKISEILIKDEHDLIHKAVGWMLREVGKKNQDVLKDFLKKHYKQMPRTMLRYAIEKFGEEKRKKYLTGAI